MLTDTQCRTAKPKDKPYKLSDGKGLYLEIKPNGVKAWRYRFELREGDVAKESIFAIGDYAIAPSGETQEEGQARRGGRRFTLAEARDERIKARALDVRLLQCDGLLTPGRAFGWRWTVSGNEVASIQMRTEVDRVILNYRSRSNSSEWQPMEYPVTLEWTPCHLGGRRAWFRCPARGCGRRYAGSIFACRHCHKLAYQCQRKTDDDRAMRRAETIRRRIGWEAGIANPEGDKPKGMHWRTFERLKAEHDAFANASWAGMAERLGLMSGRLMDLRFERLDDVGRDD
jgi:hypothetical protein